VLSLPGGSPGEIRLVGRLLLALRLLQLGLAAAQPLPARARVSELERQLVAARLAQAPVLLGVRLRGLGEHPLDLRPDRGVAARRPRRGIAGQQAAVERDEAYRYEPRPRAQRQYLREGVGQRLLMAGAKAGDRRVVGDLVGREHAEGDASRQRRSMPRLERSPTA
jgi:hypothetical protein